MTGQTGSEVALTGTGELAPPETWQEYAAVQEALTEVALRPTTTEAELLRSLAENLAALGQGFALFSEGEQGPCLQSLYGPEGTEFLLESPSGQGNGAAAMDWPEGGDPAERGRAQSDRFLGQLESLSDWLPEESLRELARAFGPTAGVLVTLSAEAARPEFLLVAGPDLESAATQGVIKLADRLALSLAIVRLRAELWTAEQKQERLFKGAEAPLMLVDSRHVILDANPKVTELLGLGSEDLRGRPLGELLPQARAWIENCWEAAPDVRGPTLEADYRRPDGRCRQLRLASRRLNVAGEQCALISLDDLSQVQRLEEMVRRLDHLKDEIASHMSVGMVLQDANGFFAHVNEAAARMLGREVEELLGEPWEALLPKDPAEGEGPAPSGRRNAQSRHEVELIHKSGDRVSVLVSETPFKEGGVESGKIALLTDITAQRRAEQRLLEQNRAFQRVLGRLRALNQAASGALRGLDAAAIIRLVGDELQQLGMCSLVVTLEEESQEWIVRHTTAPLTWRTASGAELAAGATIRLPVATEGHWFKTLTEGAPILLAEGRKVKQVLGVPRSPFSLHLALPEQDRCVLAPMRAAERLTGVLVVWGSDLCEDDLPAITAFSNHLSIALESARLFADSISHAERGKALAEIIATASAELDMAVLLQESGGRILEVLEYPACTFLSLDREGGTLTVLVNVAASSSLKERLPPPGSLYALHDCPAAREAVEERRPQHAPPIGPDVLGVEQGLAGGEGRATLALPMETSGSVFGLVVLYAGMGAQAPSPEEMSFLRTAVEQVAVGFEKARLAAESRLQMEADRALSALVERTLASQDVSDVVGAALSGMSSLLPCHHVSITSFDFRAGTARVLGAVHGRSRMERGQAMQLKEWGATADLQVGKMIYREDQRGSGPLRMGGMRGLGAYKSLLSLPLQLGGEVFGALTIGHRQPNAYPPSQIDLAGRFANQLAVALANAHHFETASRRAGELSALYDLALDISGELELRPLLQTSIARACELLETACGAIFLVDEPAQELSMAAGWNLTAAKVAVRLRKGQGLPGQVWQRAEPILLHRRRDLGDPSWLESCYAQGSALAVPLFWSGEVRGVIAVFNPTSERHFEPGEARLLERMAAQVSLGLENVQKHEQIKRRVSQLRVVQDLGRRITSILEQEQLLKEVVRRVAHSFNLELVVLFLVQGEELHESASYYLPEDCYGYWEPVRLRIGRDGICGLAAEDGEARLLQDVAKDPNYLRILPVEAEMRSAVAVALKLKGRTIGVLLAESERLAAFDPTDMDALRALSAHVSTGIENARLYEETRSVQARLAEAEKLRSLGLMTGGIAHDFNNLLAVILARAELALREIEAPRLRAHLEQVIASAQDGGETIRRLQNFARTQKDTSDFVAVDLNRVAREAIELSRPRWKDEAQGAGVDIQVETDLQAAHEVLGAPVQLRELLINLIFNAIEAMPEGGTLRLVTRTDGDGAHLRVEDTGVGMSGEVKRQIFVPYFTTKQGGTGLGMSMVYGVVQRHGGRIEVESEPQKGTSVRVWLPGSDPEGRVARTAQERIAFPPAAEASILVVEDDEAIREGLVEIFDSGGHRVLAAGDGEEGWNAFLGAEKVDIIFTDLGMPKLGGWELVERVRARDQAIPIVILSGWGDQVEASRVRELDVAEVIPKPFTLSDLHAVLNAHLKPAKPER